MPNRVVVGAQWGDEGKAKIVDFLTEDADVVIRFQGGANAGHTVEVGDQKFVFHLIPSGIMHPHTQCVIGNGVVLDPVQILKEIEEIKEKGIEVDGRLFISDAAHVVMPYHKQIDVLREEAAGKNAIGTTGRGIGPAYLDKVNRMGIRVGDLLDPESLKQKISRCVEDHNSLVTRMYNAKPVDAATIYEEYRMLGEKIRKYVTDTSVLLHESLKNQGRLIFEGAQGTILDVDHGTYPFVTSSSTVAGSACCGSGVGPKAIDQVIGVVKAYTTRVGNGPFPTEMTDALGEFLREEGGEYGATTGRKRRCGWFDAVVVRKAAIVNGLTHLALTKLDVLDKFDDIKVCTEYTLDGKATPYFPSRVASLERAEPVYETLPGWKSKTSGITKFDELPANAKAYLKRLAELVGVPIGMLSLGPKRHQTIVIDMG